MKIGVFSRHSVRLCWYSSCFPEHRFLHFIPETPLVNEEECDHYIVDGDLLTEDHESYGELTRCINWSVLEALERKMLDPCLPRSTDMNRISIEYVRDGKLKMIRSSVKIGVGHSSETTQLVTLLKYA